MLVRGEDSLLSTEHPDAGKYQVADIFPITRISPVEEAWAGRSCVCVWFALITVVKALQCAVGAADFQVQHSQIERFPYLSPHRQASGPEISSGLDSPT